ncbi:flagellar basal body P-ring formation chaperone FlgA [Opitutales bacterium]|nr:flagellar basal body P-ring formation chaperone FlgA [Opitutales bacterium]
MFKGIATYFIILVLPCFLFGDVTRFLDPISIRPSSFNPGSIVGNKTSASIAPSKFLRNSDFNIPEHSSVPVDFLLSRELLEAKLGELLSHRYQVSGKITAYVTRQWSPVKLSGNFIIKIRDCMPDQLCPSTFIRFAIWDNGVNIGEFAEPIRVSHFVEAFYTKGLLPRGSKVKGDNLIGRPVDVLKQHVGAVPVGTNLKGYQLGVNLRENSVLKWSHLTKVALVKKGEIVDVYASGSGIYISMKGMALENGVEGGFVKVRNLSSDKEFQAKVLNEKSVKVQL